MTKQTLLGNGYALDGLESKPIAPEVWEQADVIINMSGRARELAFREFAKVEDWEVEDPYGDAEAYAGTFAIIKQRVAELAARLTEPVPLQQVGRVTGGSREKSAKSDSPGEDA
jgi:protein-tyrosine-phosphatase